VYLLGDDNWKQDTRKFLEETFGFVRCVNYDSKQHGPSSGQIRQSHHLVMAYIGSAVRAGEATIEAAACIAAGMTVVLVVEDVDPAAVARLRRKDGRFDQSIEKMTAAEALGINQARASLRSIATRFPSTGGSGCVMVDDATQAQFAVIDLLSPAREDADAGPVSPHFATTVPQPPSPRSPRNNVESSHEEKKSETSSKVSSHGLEVEIHSTGNDHLDDVVKRATEAALLAMQRRHEEDLARAMQAHEQQLRVAAKELQNQALLKERRYFR
jgi:hypothetical protein